MKESKNLCLTLVGILALGVRASFGLLAAGAWGGGSGRGEVD